MGKPWYLSKTKLGSVLVGASFIIGGVGYYLTGEADLFEAFKSIAVGVSAILLGLGLRDAISNLE